MLYGAKELNCNKAHEIIKIMFIFTIQLRVSKPGFVIRFRFKAPCSECYGAFILGHTQKT